MRSGRRGRPSGNGKGGSERTAAIPASSSTPWDDEAWTFEHVRLGYDMEGAIARIEQAGLPRILGERLRYGE